MGYTIKTLQKQKNDPLKNNSDKVEFSHIRFIYGSYVYIRIQKSHIRSWPTLYIHRTNNVYVDISLQLITAQPHNMHDPG